jgi:hypothetical protein
MIKFIVPPRQQALDQVTLDDQEIYSAFISKPLIEALAIKTRLSRISTEQGCPDSVSSLLRVFSRADDIIFSYDYLIHTLVNKLEYSWRKSPEQKMQIISHVFSQTKTLKFYNSLFSTFGFHKEMDFKSIIAFAEKEHSSHIQETKSLLAVDVLNEYHFYDLYNLIKAKRVNEIFEDFWKKSSPRLRQMALNKKGLLVSESNDVKVFQINKENKEVSLVYVTPRHMAVDPEGTSFGKLNNIVIKSTRPTRSVCFIEEDVTFKRKEFLRVPQEEKNDFSVRIKVPINLYKIDGLSR